MARAEVFASGVLLDTGILLDYLAGDPRAQKAMAAHTYRSISVVSWLEIMAACPPPAVEATRGFLRTLERFSINESIADEALRLMTHTQTLPLNTALTWATAKANHLRFLTTNCKAVNKADPGVVIAYEATEIQ